MSTLWLWVSCCCALTLQLHQCNAAATVILTSSIEGMAACLWEEVVFTCRTTESSILTWSSDQFSSQPQEISFLSGSPQNTPVVDGNFTATLTEVIPKPNIPSIANFTSTLAVTATVELNGTVIKCANQLVTWNQTLLVAGMASPPLSPTSTIQTYHRHNFTVRMEWEDSTSGADTYTISSDTSMETVPGSETSAILTLSYNMVHTVTITATLCGDVSEAVTVNITKVSCGDPTPPSNGSIGDYESTAEGTEINYQCDDGLIPGGEMMSTCLVNGTWSPDPAELECVEPSGCRSPALSPNASVEGYNDTVEGLVVIYSCNPGLIPEGEFRSVCREDTGTWDPDPTSTSQMCREPGTPDDCGYPDPPVNGSFGGDITSTVEGSEITYQCGDGLTPEGNMTAVCGEDGEWRPNPGDVECRSTTEDRSENERSDSAAVVVTVTVTAGVLFLVVLTIAAVVTGALCYCHSRRQKNKPTSQQPEAEYEEIPGEQQKPQGAIEMKENTAYGPVISRGGPVYELVPGGGGGGARRSNEGIHIGENAAYGQLRL